MSVDATAAALARLQVEDAQLKQNLNKLHLSHQHSFLPWKHLSAAHLHTLAGQSVAERRETVREVLRLTERFPLGEVHTRGATDDPAVPPPAPCTTDPNLTRQEIVLDLALSVLGFCWTSELSALKSSTFFSVLYTLHMSVAERPGPYMGAAEAWALFESLLLRHAVERPPFSIAVFAASEVDLLTKWTMRTYFAQLRHYQYAFGTSNELELVCANSVAQAVQHDIVGVPLFTTDKLDQAWSLDFAKNYFETSSNATAQPGQDEVDADEDEELEAEAPEDDGEFRDDVTGVEFLQSAAASALSSASGVTGGSALLNDPADQALFDAAMARELASLQTAFAAQLDATQQSFAKRMAELDAALPPAPAQHTARSNAPAASPSRVSKSRGKV